MTNYRLVYLQPFEYDDDSPDGIGDHSIEWSQAIHIFEAESDAQAAEVVVKFLDEGSVVFSIDGLERKRHPVSLEEMRKVSVR